MKFEKISSKKFEPFLPYSISNLHAIIGGYETDNPVQQFYDTKSTQGTGSGDSITKTNYGNPPSADR